MRGKLLFIAGAAVGFVLGSRQGRQAYERIKHRAADVWTDPKVRDGVAKVAGTVEEKVPGGDKLVGLARKAGEKVDEAATAPTTGGSSGATGSTS